MTPGEIFLLSDLAIWSPPKMAKLMGTSWGLRQALESILIMRQGISAVGARFHFQAQDLKVSGSLSSIATVY